MELQWRWRAICNAPSAKISGPTARGERNITLVKLERIAKQLKVDPLALLQRGSNL